MLQTTGITLGYQNRKILSNISFALQDKEKAALIGENGAGKTTLLRIIAGEIQPDSGSVTITGSQKKIAYVPQQLVLEKATQNLDVLTFMLEARRLASTSKRLAELEKILKKNCDDGKEAMKFIEEYSTLLEEFQNLQGYKAEDDILEILSGVGLNTVDLDQTVQTLSGGQKTRIMLARMLFQDAGLLLLDEPTNHIDPASVDWLARYLAQTQQAILVVSHDRIFLDRIVRRIFHLEIQTGKFTSYPGNYSKFLELSSHSKKSLEKHSEKITAQITRHKHFIQTAGQRQIGLRRSRQKLVAKLEKELPNIVKPKKKMDISFPLQTELRSEAISLDSVFMKFGTRQILSKISFRLGPQEKLGIMGENGAGKTTLLRIIARNLAPTKGQVKVHNKVQLGWYRQEQEGLTDNNSVFEEAKKVLPTTGQNIRRVLAHFLFGPDQVNQTVYTLSRGERARLALCKIMLEGCNVLLLDEPTNHLDVKAKESLVEALQNYSGALLIVSHDKNFLQNIGIAWALHLPDGQLVRVEP